MNILNKPDEDDTKMSFEAIAGIDFGTCNSGYAFTFTKNSKDIFKSEWTDGVGAYRHTKCPTTILFNEKLEFDSFGFDAINNYGKIVEEKKTEKWHFVKRFKMQLHNRVTKNKDFEIQDELGRRIPAMKVFSESIRFLKNQLGETLQNRRPTNSDQILWIITIPAIWNESAKTFMRKAAIEAGILDDNLELALEPEAAAMFCMLDGALHGANDEALQAVFKPSGMYMIVDLGGGTVDTTVHKVDENCGLIEMVTASGGDWGGGAVDRNFLKYLNEVLGVNFVQRCKQEYAADWIQLMADFETRKREVTPELDRKFRLKLPPRFLAQSDMKVNMQSFDKHDVPHDEVIKFFNNVTEKVVSHIRKVLSEIPECNVLLFVGGFSQSKFIQDVIKRDFRDKKIYIPLEAETAVLQGSVHFGLDPRRIVARKIRYTYGVRLYKRFREKVDPDEYKKFIDGEVLCKNRFLRVVSKDESVNIDEKKEVITTSTHKDTSRQYINILFSLFSSDEDSPEYADSRCNLIGNIRVEPPAEGWPIKVEYRIELMFGRAELKVVVHNNASNEEYSSTFELPEI